MNEDDAPGWPLPAESCVARSALDRWADAQPDRAFAMFTDGRSWTYGEFRAVVIRQAIGLQRLGVRQGECVLVWLPNGSAALAVLFAINYIGAVAVPINTAYKGALLEHVIRNSAARHMVAHADLLPRLAEIDRYKLETLVALGETTERVPHLKQFAADALNPADGTLMPLERPFQPWDTQSIIYTSGTTGPSKGVLSSYLHACSSVGPRAWPCVEADDRFFINLPMFHIGGMFICHSMLCSGGSIAMSERFSTESFWDEARATGATVVFLLGVMASFLMQRPADAGDHDHPLRRVIIVPFTQSALGFAERFGVETYTLFNMTEVATPTFSAPYPQKPGTCGRRRSGIEIRLVDENDCEVPDGAVGEMIVRSDRPWSMNHGYNQDPQATARAWRNGWFHTGDAFYIDENEEYIFVDRLKDAIRRRGENISSAELEAEMLAFPGVREAAAIAVPGEHGEDEVLAVIALAPGADAPDPVAFVDFLAGRLPYFMVPRYLRIVTELPKTPTAKIQKAALRRDGVTADSWDRVASGVEVKQERLGQIT